MEKTDSVFHSQSDYKLIVDIITKIVNSRLRDNPELAKDIISESSLRAWLSISSNPNIKDPLAYAARITFNTMSSMLSINTKIRDAHCSFDNDNNEESYQTFHKMFIPHDNPLTYLETREYIAGLARIIGITHSFVHNQCTPEETLIYQEIIRRKTNITVLAEIMDLSEDALNQRVFRFMRKISDHVENEVRNNSHLYELLTRILKNEAIPFYRFVTLLLRVVKENGLETIGFALKSLIGG